MAENAAPGQALTIRPPPPENKSSQRAARNAATWLSFIGRTVSESAFRGKPGGRSPGDEAAQLAMYVYSTDGEPVGFVFETSIYDLEGMPLGRILGCRVHRFDGSYVGEWFRDMVVRRPSARPRMVPATDVPARRPPAAASFTLRAVVDYGYPDAFPLLRADGYASAAE